VLIIFSKKKKKAKQNVSSFSSFMGFCWFWRFGFTRRHILLKLPGVITSVSLLSWRVFPQVGFENKTERGRKERERERRKIQRHRMMGRERRKEEEEAPLARGSSKQPPIPIMA
jgi:hypothetical protein